jgi:hypothetical protein
VVLLDWSDRSLERQIQLGQKTGINNNTRKAKITYLKVKLTFINMYVLLNFVGDIDINLARFEMNNYRQNIIPVAQFFDQQGHLHIVRRINKQAISLSFY